MLAGVATREITPLIGEPLTFYGPTRGALDPLQLQVLALEQDGCRVLVVAADVLGFRRDLVEVIRADLGRAVGVPPEAILVTYSHTHYGPQTLTDMCRRTGAFAQGYVTRLREQIAAAAREAVAGLAPVVLRLGRGQAVIGTNRRKLVDGKAVFTANPDGPMDTTVTAIELERPGTTPLAVLFHYTCHPTTRAGEDGLASADWPGAARATIEAALPGSVAIFLQGCSGDIRPARFKIDGSPGFRYTDAAEMQALGAAVGAEVMRVLRQALPVLTPAIYAAEVEVTLPYGPLPGPAELAAARKQERDDWKHWADLHSREPWRLRPTCRFHMQRLDLAAGARLIAMEGEMVQDYGLAIQALGAGLLPMGYSNGLVSYIPSDHMITEGGYEVDVAPAVFMQPAPFTVGTEGAIMAGVRALLRIAEARTQES